MIDQIIKEIQIVEAELKNTRGDILKGVCAGRLSGLKMGLALLNNYNITDETKFFCWGSRILSIEEGITSGKERARHTLSQIIKNNKAAVGRDMDAVFTPFLQGHSIGLESVLLFL